MALSACGGGGGSTGGTGTTPTQTSGVSGKVVDGYINGATVFCDANKNGVADAGEASTVTSGQGDFSLPSACSAYLVSTGGTDVSTGYPFKGMLKSPAGAAIISPLTTLLADTGLSNAQLSNHAKLIVKFVPNALKMELTSLSSSSPFKLQNFRQ